MKASIRTKSDRAKLPPRREPYWERLQTGAYVGYRKLKNGEGTWIARWRDEHGKQHYKALGQFDAYDEAQKSAQEWIRQCENGISPKATTVEQACRDYVDHLRTHKGEAAAHDAEIRLKRLAYGQKIGKIDLDRLKASDVRAWLNSQVAESDDPEIVRKSKTSANRCFVTLSAALSHAWKSGLVATNTAWRTVAKFPSVSKRREVFLSLDERRRLLNACEDDLRDFVIGLLLTAARPGELAKVTVGDFDRKNGTLVLCGKTGRRTVSLSSAAIEHFTKMSKGKLRGAYLFMRADGLPWTADRWKFIFKRIVKEIGLRGDTCLYNIRHTAISEMIMSGVDAFTVARLAGTSTTMIDKHYGHLVHASARSRLDQAQMI